MSAEYYIIPDNPVYDDTSIRKIQDSDPVRASTIVNPVVERLIENIAAVKQLADLLGITMEGLASVDYVREALSGGQAGSAEKLSIPRTIDGMAFDGSSPITHYGTCATAAATAAKVVALSGFALASGARIVVKFIATNTAANPTLNVNSTGAKAIYYRGGAIGAGILAAGRTYEFVYNGSEYELVGDINTDTTYNAATSTAAGLLSAADKAKLDGIAAKATANAASATTPKAAGTAAVGTEAAFARGDHVHPAQTSVTGNAGTATKLATARTLRVNLASTATATFDGSANVTPGVTGTLGVGSGGTGVTTLAALASALQSSGGMCKIATGSYVGNGLYGASNPCSLTFPFSPMFVLIMANLSATNLVKCELMGLYRGCNTTRYLSGSNCYTTKVTWNGNSVSYYYDEYASYQCNVANKEYYYVVLG